MSAETAKLLFELSILGEISSRDFYEGLAGKFCREINISAFWQNMAADEMQHIEALEDLRKYLAPDRLSAPADADILEIALENSRIKTADVLNMVHNLNDAYVLALLWENSEINRVFEFLINQYMPTGADGRSVHLHLMTHRKKLHTFLQAFGDAEIRMSIPAADG